MNLRLEVEILILGSLLKQLIGLIQEVDMYFQAIDMYFQAISSTKVTKYKSQDYFP